MIKVTFIEEKKKEMKEGDESVMRAFVISFVKTCVTKFNLLFRIATDSLLIPITYTKAVLRSFERLRILPS